MIEALRPFWGVEAVEPDAVLAGLIVRGWALRDPADRFSLSPEGDAARATLLEKVKSLRTAIADGITPEQYNTTVDTLGRMAENLRAMG